MSDKENLCIIDGCEIGEGTTIEAFTALHDCSIGEDCHIWRFSNLYGMEMGNECMVGSLVEIQSDVNIGNRCRIQSHAFVCSLVTIADDVFISHGAKFINDLYPPSGNEADWEETTIKEGATIGTNATILPVEIGKNAMVGAGSVVTDDVPDGAIVAGNPAEVVGHVDDL